MLKKTSLKLTNLMGMQNPAREYDGSENIKFR